MDCSCLNLAQNTFWQFPNGDTAAGRFEGEIFDVNLFKGGKIAYVRQEAGGLERMFKISAGSFQNRTTYAQNALPEP